MTIRPVYLLLLLSAITLGAYYPTLFAPLNSLDDQLYFQRLFAQETFSWSSHFSPGGLADYFRPVTSLSFQIDKYVGGLQESFMHLLNILVHVANVILIFFLARLLSHFTGQENRLLPWVAALLFAVHPINTEAVNWISSRTDLLAGLFVFSSLICLMLSVKNRSFLWGVLGAALFFLGTLCKETALFMFPAVLLICIWRPLIRVPYWKTRGLLLVPYSLAVGSYFFLRSGALTIDRGLDYSAKVVAHTAGVSAAQTTVSTADSWPLFEGIRVLLKVSGYYAVKLFQPLPLNFAISKVPWWYTFPGILLLVILAFALWRRKPVDVFLLTSAAIAVSALFVVLTQLAWSPVAERYMYVPCGPFTIAVVYGVAPFITSSKKSSFCAVIVLLLVSGAAWATVKRNIVWQDNLTLYEDTVRKSPDFAPAKNELAMALYAHGRGEEARALLETIQIKGQQRASLNQAAVYAERGEYEAARDFLKERLDDPGPFEARILEMLIKITSQVVDNLEDHQDKEPYFREILLWLNRISEISSNPFTDYRKGRIYLWLGELETAQKHFAIAAERLPEHSVYKAPAQKLATRLAEPEGSH